MRRSLVVILTVLLTGSLLYAGGNQLRFKQGSFDPLTAKRDQAKASAFYVSAYPKGEVRLHVVQYDRPVGSDDIKRLTSFGLQVLDYIPDHAYIVMASTEQMDRLKLPSIRWKGIFQPDAR